uniref:Uncharacterized protein n=1 Tax=Myripristis murdjan TaxID=586833 RepID=A0A668ATU4_9TELE
MTALYRKMFVLCATVLLYLTSGSHSAPLSCEELVRPLDQLEPHHLEGRWALVAGSISNLTLVEIFKRRDSSGVDFTTHNGTFTASYTRNKREGDKCHYGPSNISFEGSTFTFDDESPANLTGTFLHTSCPDCLLMHFDVQSKKRFHTYLFSKRRELEQKEMEEFKAQLECLKMPPPVVMDPTKELCPEQTSSEPAAAQTDVDKT